MLNPVKPAWLVESDRAVWTLFVVSLPPVERMKGTGMSDLSGLFKARWLSLEQHLVQGATASQPFPVFASIAKSGMYWCWR